MMSNDQPSRTIQNAVLVTGATGGIGWALCDAFAAADYFIIASDLATTSDLPYPYLPLDLAQLPNNHELQRVFLRQLDDTLDGRPLYCCVNNAAVQILGGLAEVRDQDFQHSLNVNLIAPFILSRLLLPLLEAAGGSIVNIGSIHARQTKAGFVSYATTKTALLGLTQSLAVDLGGRVRVNIIQPAAVATEMLKAGFVGNPAGYAELERYHPVGRIGDPTEVASAAVFLASKAASFISGVSLDVDGGIGVKLHDPEPSLNDL